MRKRLITTFLVGSMLLMLEACGNKEQIEIPDETEVEAEEGTEIEAAEEKAAEQKLPVINNGGTIIQVGGKIHDIKDKNLYSDGRYLYANGNGADGESYIAKYELSFEQLLSEMPGEIVACSAEDNSLFYMTEVKENGSRTLSYFNTEKLSTKLIIEGNIAYIGKGTDAFYISRREAEGLYFDKIAFQNGEKEENILGKPLEVSDGFQVTSFYENEEYVLFAGGEVQGSMGLFHGDFYSFHRSTEELRQEHLTDAGEFVVIDDYIYYQAYQNQGEDSNELKYAAFDLEEQGQVGNKLQFVAYDEEKRLIYAQDSGVDSAWASFISIRPDGSERKELLSMVGQPGWEYNETYRVEYSDVNVLSNSILVKAKLLGYDEEFSIGWRDAVLIEEYYRIPKDGGTPEQFYTISNFATAYLWASVVGKPCNPEEKGWNLNGADDTYLLKQEGNFTLYRKDDLERTLLQYEGEYAEIHYLYSPNYVPALFEQDYDGDGQQELAIRLKTKYGSGFSIDTLLMADREEEGLLVYQYLEENFFDTIKTHLTYERQEGEQSGLQAYLDGFPAGSLMADGEGMEFSFCTVGNLAHFEFCEIPVPCIKLWVGLEFYTEGAAIARNNGAGICADVVYQGNGEFSLGNFEVSDRDW